MPLLCSRCKDRELQAHHLEGWKVYVCTECGGLWIGADAFREAIRKPPPAAATSSEISASQAAVWGESALSCPRCKRKMKKGVYSYSSGVIIDRCESCSGIWLDRGELAKIRAFVNREPPRERILMAELQAEQLRRRAHARDRGRAGTRAWGEGGMDRVFSFLRDLFYGSLR